MKWIAAVALVGILSACSGTNIEYNYPRTGQGGKPTYESRESLLGEGGLNIFGSEREKNGQNPGGGGGSGIAVNAFLWRASLDTLSFMPLASADPFGGVIITDWYSPEDTKAERFKVTVYILDRALRSDGIRANVFRQEGIDSGSWVDVAVDSKVSKELEDTILTRARELRIQQTSN